MAKQRLKSPRARLFVALELPDPIREGLARWQREEIEPIPVLRALAPEALHVTLAFLGYRPMRDIDRVAALLDEVEAPAPTLRFDADATAVPKGRPRLFAIGAESPEAKALQGEVASVLSAARLYEPEKRDFWPHVTIARVRPGKRGSKRPVRVDVTPRSLPSSLTEPFRSVRVALYRSILRPQGAEYVRLAATELPSADGADG